MNLRSVVAAVAAVAPARGSPARPRGSRFTRRRILLRTCAGTVAAASVLATLLVLAEFHYVYFNRRNLPDLGPFTRFEFSTIGHVYDAGGTPLIELAREYRDIVRYEAIPPIVRDAILAAEDKRFFSHNGIDYLSVPRVLGRVRVGMLAGRLVRGGRHDEVDGVALLPQGDPRLLNSSCGAPREGRDSGPVRERGVYGQRSARVRKGRGILLWPAARDPDRE